MGLEESPREFCRRQGWKAGAPSAAQQKEESQFREGLALTFDHCHDHRGLLYLLPRRHLNVLLWVLPIEPRVPGPLGRFHGWGPGGGNGY